MVTLGSARDQGKTIDVDVLASFAAGESLEAERACVDAVNDQAVVDLTVDVVLVFGMGQTSSQDLVQSATYEYDGVGLPDVQKEPAAVALDFGFTPTAAGFTALDFAFHEEDPDNRGAYLRTLAFAVDPVGGAANGTATNYSPGTQLSGFEFSFAGTVSAVDFPLSVERGTITETLDTELDDAGVPVVYALAY
jgi:hypothetical protein